MVENDDVGRRWDQYVHIACHPRPERASRYCQMDWWRARTKYPRFGYRLSVYAHLEWNQLDRHPRAFAQASPPSKYKASSFVTKMWIIPIYKRYPVRHQNSVCRISTNPIMRIWESVFLIRLSLFFVRFPDFKIRLNIGLYEYINTVCRNTKCYSKIGIIGFWNHVVCRLPCFPPFRLPKQQVPATSLLL